MKLIFLLVVSLVQFFNHIQRKVILSLFRLDGLLKLNRCNICYTWGNICYSVECLIDACLVAQLCSSPRTVACRVLSMGFPRQEYWSGLPLLFKSDCLYLMLTLSPIPCLALLMGLTHFLSSALPHLFELDDSSHLLLLFD